VVVEFSAFPTKNIFKKKKIRGPKWKCPEEMDLIANAKPKDNISGAFGRTVL